MGSVIGDILPLAIGVAISPMPIIAVILMLFSERARANSLAAGAGSGVRCGAIEASRLKEQGIISGEESNAKKERILGI